MSKLFDFPNSKFTEDEQEHRCDGCASSIIYNVAQQFEEFDNEPVIDECLSKIFNAEQPEEIVDAVLELYDTAYLTGEKEFLKEEIQMKSEMLAMLCADVSGDEQ